eukprot:5098410-Prymnesium_polylepis.1
MRQHTLWRVRQSGPKLASPPTKRDLGFAEACLHQRGPQRSANGRAHAAAGDNLCFEHACDER